MVLAMRDEGPEALNMSATSMSGTGRNLLPPSPVTGVPGGSAVKRAVAEHGVFLCIVGGYLLLSVALDGLNVANVFRPHLWSWDFALLALTYLAGVWPFVAALEIRRRGLAGLRAAADPCRVLGALIATLGVVGLFKTHDNWKALIGERGFTLDARLGALDALIHGGSQPWVLLPQATGMTVALDQLYVVWYPLMIAVLSWQAWSSYPSGASPVSCSLGTNSRSPGRRCRARTPIGWSLLLWSGRPGTRSLRTPV